MVALHLLNQLDELGEGYTLLKRRGRDEAEEEEERRRIRSSSSSSRRRKKKIFFLKSIIDHTMNTQKQTYYFIQ